MISDIIDFSNSQLKIIREDSNKIHPSLLQPIYRISQVDDELCSEELFKKYKSTVEPTLVKFKKDLKNKIKEYLILMGDELILMGLPLGLNLETSEEIFTTDEFAKLYDSGVDFYPKSPFKNIMYAVEEQFKFAFSLKPFWEVERSFKHNNSSFHIYPKSDNISYIKQITAALDINQKTTETTIDKLSSFAKRRDSLPYKITTDIPSSGIYPFYNTSISFDEVLFSIEQDLLLHEVLYCIKNDEKLYAAGAAFNININDYL